MTSNRNALVFWIALAGVLGLFGGYAIARLFFLNGPFSNFVRQIEYKLQLSGRSPSIATDVIATQYRVNDSKIDRKLDSAFLPFRIRSVSASGAPGFPLEGGAVTMVGQHLLVVDRLGNFFQCTEECAEITKAPLPPIPNNILEYVSFPHSLLDERHFRTHSARYSSSLHMLAVSYELFDSSLASARLAVSIIDLDSTTLQTSGSWTTVFLADPEPNDSNDQAGGGLAWRDDGKLFLAIGDFTMEATKAPQDLNSSFGKVFEIDVRSRSHRLLSSGLRNPEGLAWTKAFGLVSIEHGPQGGDRLDQIVEGANYGWPRVSLGTDYHRYTFGDRNDGGRIDGYVPPIYAWVPSIAPSAVIELRNFDERWDGDLLVASLKAQRLFRLRLNDSRVIYSEPIFLGKRIRDLAVMRPGVLALWTDDGQIVLMSIDREKLETNRREPSSLPVVVADACLYCHHFGPTNDSDFAPSFTGLLGRPVASDRFLYSAGLRKVGGVWTADALRRFLSDPAGFANGTSMPQLRLVPQSIDEIVAEFERLRGEANANVTP
jgi:cytochrome c2